MNIIDYKKIDINGKMFIEFPALEPYFKILLSTSDNFLPNMVKTEKIKNLEEICSYLETEKKYSLSCLQTHSDNINLVFESKNESLPKIEILPCIYKNGNKEKENTNYTTDFFGKEFENSDAIITNNNKNLLIMKFADCTPIIIYDKKNKIIANIHSGWRGCAQKIFQKTIDIFLEKGSNPEDLIVFIAPSILKDSFEVKQDLIDIFNKSYGDISKYIFPKNEDSYLFDMRDLIVDEIIKYEIPSYNIYTTNLCTYENSFLHSFRRDDDKSGRMYLCVKMN